MSRDGGDGLIQASPRASPSNSGSSSIRHGLKLKLLQVVVHQLLLAVAALAREVDQKVSRGVLRVVSARLWIIEEAQCVDVEWMKQVGVERALRQHVDVLADLCDVSLVRGQPPSLGLVAAPDRGVRHVVQGPLLPSERIRHPVRGYGRNQLCLLLS